MANVCAVCSKGISIYKCPTCYIKYCSVDCFKKHKNSPCHPPKHASHEHSKERGSTTKTDDCDVTEDYISTDKLQCLGKDAGVLKCLQNPYLRDMICMLDTCDNPQEMVQNAMMNPVFVEFADNCLRVVQPDD